MTKPQSLVAGARTPEQLLPSAVKVAEALPGHLFRVSRVMSLPDEMLGGQRDMGLELIADVMQRPASLVHVPKAPFGGNLVYDCHAVYATTRIRRELGIRPRYTLAAGVAQTYEWYRREGLDRRAVDFTEEDALLASLR